MYAARKKWYRIGTTVVISVEFIRPTCRFSACIFIRLHGIEILLEESHTADGRLLMIANRAET